MFSFDVKKCRKFDDSGHDFFVNSDRLIVIKRWVPIGVKNGVKIHDYGISDSK